MALLCFKMRLRFKPPEFTTAINLMPDPFNMLGLKDVPHHTSEVLQTPRIPVPGHDAQFYGEAIRYKGSVGDYWQSIPVARASPLLCSQNQDTEQKMGKGYTKKPDSNRHP